MSFIPIIFMVLFYGFITVALVYFIIKRVADKDKEDFEKRDN